MNSYQHIEVFLSKVCEYIDCGKVDFIMRDRKNLYQLGLNYRSALTIIKELTYNDYLSGPEQDHSHPSQEVYKFGIQFEGIDIYIKMTFRIRDDLFIMSFHEADFELRYIFK